MILPSPQPGERISTLDGFTAQSIFTGVSFASNLDHHLQLEQSRLSGFAAGCLTKVVIVLLAALA